MPDPIFRGFTVKLGRKVGDKTKSFVHIENVEDGAEIKLEGELGGTQYIWSGEVNILGASGIQRVNFNCDEGDPKSFASEKPDTSDDIILVTVTVTNDPDAENPISTSTPDVPVELVP